MDSTVRPPRYRVVILQSDQLCAETLRVEARRAVAGAEVLLCRGIGEAGAALAAEPADLFVTGVGSSSEGDMLDFLCSGERAPARRTFVVLAQCEDRVLAALRNLPIHGVFDSSQDRPASLREALRLLAAGGRYWSPSAVERVQRHHLTPRSIFRQLSAREQLVLSVVGGGCDDQAASEELGLRPATITTIRRELHRKLGVQHRGELVRVAAQHGFVRFTPEGVRRPGFSLLAAACRARAKKTPAVRPGPPWPKRPDAA